MEELGSKLAKTSDGEDYNVIKAPQYKSLMKVGNINVYNIKHFNCFQKFIWKILLGIDIQDIKGDKNEKV